MNPRFFFSSRRRHTRFDCDWSSDVCSSDLPAEPLLEGGLAACPDAPLHHHRDWHGGRAGRGGNVDGLTGSGGHAPDRSEEHTSELQSQSNLVCRLLLEKKKKKKKTKKKRQK